MPGALRRTIYRLHFAFGCVVGVVSFLGISLAGVLFVLVVRRQARRAPVLFARTFSFVMRTILGWRLDVEGLATFESAAPAMIVANHQSNLDIVTYGTIFPRQAVAVGKKEIGRIPFFGWFFAATGNLLLDRQNRTRAFDTITEAAERIRTERISVWMFPEGHRNQKDTLLPFKKGAFHLAIAARVPVVVVVSEPIGCILDAHRGLVRPGRLRMRVLPPIGTAGRTPADVDALSDEVHALMQRTRDELAATARARIG